MRPRNRTLRADITLIEVVVSTGVLLLLMALLGSMVVESAAQSSYDLNAASLDQQGCDLVQRLTRELSDAGGDAGGDYLTTHPRATGGTSANVVFQQRLALTNQASDWGPSIEYLLQPESGEDPSDRVDNDGDGLVDEQNLARVQGGSTITLARNVTSLSFARAAGSDALSLSLTLARSGKLGAERTVLQRQFDTVVKIRNRE